MTSFKRTWRAGNPKAQTDSLATRWSIPCFSPTPISCLFSLDFLCVFFPFDANPVIKNLRIFVGSFLRLRDSCFHHRVFISTIWEPSIIYFYHHFTLVWRLTLRKTNSQFAPENRPNLPQKEAGSSSKHTFSATWPPFFCTLAHLGLDLNDSDPNNIPQKDGVLFFRN